MKTKEIKKVVSEKKNSSPGGCYCTFIPLTDRWALKLYKTRSRAKCAFEDQKRANERGLGPDVGGFIKLDDKYGYFSEIVETLMPSAEEIYREIKETSESFSQCWDRHEADAWRRFDWCHSSEYGSDIPEEFDEILEEYESIGVDTCDAHLANWGIKKGQFMLIDFY